MPVTDWQIGGNRGLKKRQILITDWQIGGKRGLTYVLI